MERMKGGHEKSSVMPKSIGAIKVNKLKDQTESRIGRVLKGIGLGALTTLGLIFVPAASLIAGGVVGTAYVLNKGSKK